MGGIGIWQLVIIAVIILLLFGSKKLRGLGGDLGAALRGFKKEMHDDKDKEKDTQNVEHKQVDAEFREDESRKKPEHDHSKRD